MLIGDALGPYRILSKLGEGGMGDVFSARDTRLGRLVAIKVSKDRFSERFDREARAISVLNHPHICTLYDVGPDYLVLEFIDGETLTARLKDGGLPLDLVLSYGAQIADALAAAHEQGIIHRDLKPANVMVTRAGIKLLDFGLAKPSPIAASADAATTADVLMSAPQTVMGTLAYMAPEQLEGKPCDARSDVFSLGLVLFEMATGQRAFASDNRAALIADILRGQATPLTSVPEQLRHVVERCLGKDPADRWQTARDVKAELEWAAKSHTIAPGPILRPALPGWLWPAGAASLVVFLLLAAAAVFWRPAPPERTVHLALSFDGLTGELGAPVPSPDGRNFVFSAFDTSGRRSLWLRPLDAEGVRQLPGTEDAEQPCWSTDGKWIRFYAGGKFKKINLSGDKPQNIVEVAGIAAGFASVGTTCNATGDMIWSAGNRTPLFHFREGSGPPSQLTRLDPGRAENSHRFPTFLPDGRHFLFVARSGQRENNSLYLGSLDKPETRRVMTVHSNVSFVPPRDGRPGALVYVRDGALVAQPFDGERTTGEPVTIVENVEYTAPSLFGAFVVSSDGTVLIFHPATSGRRQFKLFDRSGKLLGAVGGAGDNVQPRLSPDGTRVLFSRPDEQTGNRDLWWMEISRGLISRLTTNQANDWAPVWSPDTHAILFGSDRAGGPGFAIYQKTSAELGSSETLLYQFPDPSISAHPTDWSRSGAWILFTKDFTLSRDLWTMPTGGDRTPVPLLESSFNQENARFSPDEKWIAYASNESGRYEVFVRPIAAGGMAGSGRIQVSTSGGDFPVWQRDGKELFFIGADLKLYSVDTADYQSPGAAPRPVALFAPCGDTILAGLPVRGTPWDHPYDVFPDGQRFLVNCATSDPSRFNVVLSWAESLK